MAYIPSNAQWYVAGIIEEITVEGDQRNVVHENWILVKANSPLEAYEQALTIGKKAEMTYKNPDGKSVSIKFHGLRDLNVVHDELEHGAELVYFERIGLSSNEVKKLVTSKDQLSVFCPIEQSSNPDYSCKKVIERALKMAATEGHKNPSHRDRRK